MSMRSVIVWNTGSQIVGKIATTGSIFLVNIFVARLYGVAAYGEFTKILTYIAPFYLLSDFGLNAVFLQKKYYLRKGSNNNLRNFSDPNITSLRSTIGSIPRTLQMTGLQNILKQQV